MGKLKTYILRSILRMFFTPVRALKLQIACVRAGRKVDSVHSNIMLHTRVTDGTLYESCRIQVFYHDGGGIELDCFDYGEDRALFQQERQILESLLEV